MSETKNFVGAPATGERSSPEQVTRRTGKALIAALQFSPRREIDLEPERGPLPVREVDLAAVG